MEEEHRNKTKQFELRDRQTDEVQSNLTMSRVSVTKPIVTKKKITSYTSKCDLIWNKLIDTTFYRTEAILMFFSHLIPLKWPLKKRPLYIT